MKIVSWSEEARLILDYFIRVGDATSQLANVTFLLGTNANESISGRSWRLRDRMGWSQARFVIDLLFYPFQKYHCQTAHENDLARAKKLAGIT
jgi:hypothetical protein